MSAEDLYSEVDGKNKITDQFTVEVRDECHDIVLLQDGGASVIGDIKVTKDSDSSTESTVAAPFTYDLWEQ